jgi:hypothetical protein
LLPGLAIIGTACPFPILAHRQYLIANAYKATMIASLAARDSSNSFPGLA